MTTARIYIVSPGNVLKMVPTAQPWLDKMAKWTHGRRSAEDIVRSVLNNGNNLWITLNRALEPNGALVTRVEAYPQMRMLHVLHCAGESGQMEDIEDEMYEALDKFAKFNHCKGIEFIGRRGWEGHVKHRGYTVRCVTYQKFFEGEAA